MSPSDWWHWLRGFLDEVWFAKPTATHYIHIDKNGEVYETFALSPDLILPEIDGAGGPVILGAYSSGGHYHFFVSDHPGSALTRKARDDWEDERNRRVFFQLLIDSQGGE